MNDNDTTPDAPPPSIDDMKAAIKANHAFIVDDIGRERAKRDHHAKRVRELVAELKEAERLVRALEPRKRGKA